jgi:hypothetical protein
MWNVKTVIALILALGWPLSASCQPGPGPQPQPTFSGGTLSQPLILTPSTTAAAGVNIALGVAPTSPNAGDMWATSAGLFLRFGGVTTGPLVAGAAGSSGQLQINNSGALGGITLGGDCTFSTPNITCTKTGGTLFALSATVDTTNASNVSAGTLPAGRMPALTGDVTNPVNTVATTISTAAVSNAKLANTTSGDSYKGRIGAAGVPVDNSWSNCNGNNSALQYTNGTGTGCNANVANLTVTNQNLSGGATVSPVNLTSGNITINYGSGPLQWIVNTGAFTITAPAVTVTTSQNGGLRVINGTTAANAGAVTLSGFSGKSPGGTVFATTPTVSAASVSYTNSSATVNWTANGLSLGSVVFLATTGALPTGFSTATLYYVVTTGTNTIQLSATPGGTAITAGSAGSGTQTAYVPSIFDLVVLAINGPVYAQWIQVQ